MLCFVLVSRLERCERNAALCEADDVACHEIAITCFLRHDHPAARSLASAQALICRAADPTDMDLASQCGPISAEQLKLAPPSTLLRLADALRGEGSRRRVLAIEPGEMEMYDEPRTVSPRVPPCTCQRLGWRTAQRSCRLGVCDSALLPA